MSGAKKKKSPSRIRFIPLKVGSLFSRNRPFKAVLKDTGDPRIKKILLEEDDTSPETGEVRLQSELPQELYQQLQVEARTKQKSVALQLADILREHYRKPELSEEVKKTPPLFSGQGTPIDYILFNIIEASDLLLDEADLRLKDETFHVLHHALKILLSIKKDTGGTITSRTHERLLQILRDLHRLRHIAEEEEQEHR